MRNWIGKFIHNCIAHPLMCFLPRKWGDDFHDWTARVVWQPKHTVTWDHKADVISINGIPTGSEE
jgi:hypothetical protein